MDFFQTANYFDIIGQAKKSYGRWLEPVCKKWKLTRNELDVMLFLYNNPDYDRAVDIVTRRGMAKSHVSLSVSALEAKDLLERCFEPNDRRTAHLKLTEQGRTIAGEGREVQETYFHRIYADISPEELAVWRTLTEKVCKNIENL